MSTQMDAYKLLHQGTLALRRAEQQGVRIDTKYCERERKVLTDKIKDLERQLGHTKFMKHWKHYFGKKFNIDSTFQLAHMLYKVCKITPLRFTTGGKGATDDETLTALNIPELDQLLKIRKYKKVRNTYLEAFLREQANDYLHPSYNLHLVRTYRSSSDSPNLQNIPKRDKESMQTCRKAILPRPGNQFVEIDYKGIEVCIAACYTQDPTLIRYVSDSTTDMHGDMAKQIFCINDFNKDTPHYKTLRSGAKNGFVFPQFYGDYYGNCAANLARWGELPLNGWRRGQGLQITEEDCLSDNFIKHDIKSFNDFTQHIKEIEKDFWNNRFKVYKKWKDKWWENYQKHGYMKMLTGFHCSGVMRKNEVINTPIQGVAFHCLLWSFIELDKAMRKEGWDSRLVCQIHDAILIDTNPKERQHVVDVASEIMCKRIRKAWQWIIVPLSVEVAIADINKSWSELK